MTLTTELSKLSGPAEAGVSTFFHGSGLVTLLALIGKIGTLLPHSQVSGTDAGSARWIVPSGHIMRQPRQQPRRY